MPQINVPKIGQGM